MTYDYDILFLGGGLNYAGAVIASRAGLKCALIEKNPPHLGGTCLHNGCIPSKMYLQAAESIRLSKKPWIQGELKLDMEKLDDEKEALLAAATKAIGRQCEKVDMFKGEGILTEAHTLQVGEKTLTGQYVIIGTGSHTFMPEGITYDGKQIISSDEVLNLRVLPEKIAVYGSGAIGLEMASFFAAAGVETELIWRHDTLLPKAHPMISKNLLKQMEGLGITLLSEHSIISANATPKRGVHIRFADGKEHYVPMLLAATGRKANTKAIRTEQVEIGKKGIETDEHFETTLAKHYAIGDCNGKIQLAHAARAEVKYVVQHILGKNPKLVLLDNIVKFIHTLPCSYATVGKTKADLEKSGVVYKESVLPLHGLPFTHTHEGDLGVFALYADEEGFILGAEIFSPMAEELIAIVSMALAGEMDTSTVKGTILAHPTFSESLETAFRRL